MLVFDQPAIANFDIRFSVFLTEKIGCFGIAVFEG